MAAFVEFEHVKKTYHMGEVTIDALRDATFSVEKGEREGRTYTRVERLDAAGRTEEIARLMGGGMTDALRQSAAELLRGGEAYRNTTAE